jgi:hypothetical protein
MYTKKNKKKQTYICFILFFLRTQILGLIISHCTRKPVFGMLWILDLELLLLISCIARKWNRAKTFFVRSHSPPKSPFLLRQENSRERGLWLLKGDYKKMFLLVQTYLGGQSYCSPPFNPPNQVSSRNALANNRNWIRGVSNLPRKKCSRFHLNYPYFLLRIVPTSQIVLMFFWRTR